MEKDEKIKLINKLRKQRYTYQYIGDYLGISKQRVYQLLRGNQYSAVYYHRNRQKLIEYQLKYYYRNKQKCLNYLETIRTGRQRKKVFERDKYTCQICKTILPKDELLVHHKDNQGRHNIENNLKANNKIENLQTLCSPCHSRLHSKIWGRQYYVALGKKSGEIRRNKTKKLSTLDIRKHL